MNNKEKKEKLIKDISAGLDGFNIISVDINGIESDSEMNIKICKKQVDTNELIASQEDAYRYLAKNKLWSLENPQICCLPDFSKRIRALNELLIIMRAWNFADDFTISLKDNNQQKFYPAFCISSLTDKLTFYGVDSDYNCFNPSPFYFKTSKRAEQFATQFIDLLNDFLLW